MVGGLCLYKLYGAFNFTVKTAPVGVVLRISERETCHFLIKKERVRTLGRVPHCLSELYLWIKQPQIQVGANMVS